MLLHGARRNKGISKIRYKIEQYYGFLPPSSPEASRPEGGAYRPEGLTERHMGGGKARFATLIKEH